MGKLLYSLTDVSYSYAGGISALRNLSMTIREGERVAVIGANGTGKSTLLTLLDALVFPTRGAMELGGNKITERTMRDEKVQREFRKRVGFVFQNPDVQLFCPTVREDILFGPLQLGVPNEEIRKRFADVTARLRIGPLVDRAPHQLSIGEKKKVAIASVLAIDPEILLLDEPTAGLDPQTTRDIIDVIEREHDSGKTVVMATHDLHIVEEIADTVYVFGPEKNIIRSGSAEEILTDHAFLKAHNLMHVHVHRHLHPHGNE
jgi:cobalt/nickel transport system ATP-binding protein